MEARRHLLHDGRHHLQHGPIDLLVTAEGAAPAVQAAHEAAWRRFCGLLAELVRELPLLRQPVAAGPCPLEGPVAQRMWRACAPLGAPPEPATGGSRFITPMAAVAGAVAQEVIAAYQRPGIHRAWVNNGGDIALHLAPGASVRVGLLADIAGFDPTQAGGLLDTDAQFTVRADMPVRGVATSGWRGRSFSLGVADSVTVLARSAAQADAAATVIANAVDVAHPGIVRRPASELKDDSDLGAIPVTVDVPRLPPALVEQALQAGVQRARGLQAQGLVWAAVLACQGRLASVDNPSAGRLPQAPAIGSVLA